MIEDKEKKLVFIAEKFGVGHERPAEEKIILINTLEDYPNDEAVELLNYFLSIESNPEVLLHIVKLIGNHNQRNSAFNLTELLLFKESERKNLAPKEQYLKVRCMIATILGNLKDYSAVVPLLYVLNNKDENYKLRLSAAEALGRIGDKYAVAPLIEIVTNEEEKSVYLRESAAKALGMLGDIRAVDPMVAVLEAKKGIVDRFTFLKERIIEALSRLGFRSDKAIRVLTESLNDESPYIRLSAVDALSELEDKRVTELLEPMIFDDDEDVARGAVNALYSIEGTDYIVQFLKRDNLPSWCREEIEELLENEEIDEDEDEN